MTDTNLLQDHEEYVNDDVTEGNPEVYEQSWPGGSTKKIELRDRDDNDVQHLEAGTYIDVVKNFAEAKHTYTDDKKGYELHNASVTFKGDDVQITMYGNEARKFNETGGEGDTVRIRRRKIWDEEGDRGYTRTEFIKQ